MKRVIKVWERNPRHSHVRQDGVADTTNRREADREECLFYAGCFDDAAVEGRKQVCRSDCPKYVRERRTA
jgi:hypothetical protein